MKLEDQISSLLDALETAERFYTNNPECDLRPGGLIEFTRSILRRVNAAQQEHEDRPATLPESE